VLHGLSAFYYVRAEHETGLEMAEQQLRLARNFRDPSLLLVAHMTLAYTLLFMGEFAQAREHGEQGTALYDPEQHHTLAFLYGGHDPGVVCLTCVSRALFSLVYPDQALERMHEALVLSRNLSHPFSLAHTLLYASILHFVCGEEQRAQEEVKELIEVLADQGFALWLACGAMWQDSLLAAQGQGEEGMTQIRQGLAAWRPTGALVSLPFFLNASPQRMQLWGKERKGSAWWPRRWRWSRESEKVKTKRCSITSKGS
jgi:predicted ATPase